MPTSRPRDARTLWPDYAATLVAVAGVAAVRSLLDPILGDSNPYILFVLPALYAADRAGWKPGVAALLLGVLAADVLFAAPRLSLRIDDPAHRLGALIYLAVGTAGVYLAHGRRAAQGRAEAAAAAATAESAAHRKTQEALRKQQVRLLDHAYDPILTWELGGAITSWNAGAERLYGYLAEEAIGRVSHELLHTVFPTGLAACEDALRRDGRWEGELRHRARDGTWVPVDSRMALVQRDGGPLTVLEANRDVTERATAAARLREATARAEQALARMRAVFSAAADGLVLADGRGNLLEWNPAALRLHGYEREDGLLRPIGEFVSSFVLSPPGGPPLPVDQWPMSRVLRGEHLVNHELHVRRADIGREWFISYSGTPLRGAGGEIEFAVLTLHDVTARRRAEDAVRAAEARYRLLLDVLPDAVFVHDGSRVVFCNPALARLVGAASADELLGTDPFAMAHSDHHPRLRERMAAMTQVGRPSPGMEMRVVRRDGRAVPVYSMTALLSSPDRREYLVALSDLTERERSVELLGAVMRSVLDAVVTIDEGGTVRSVNPSAERIFGHPPAELVGRNLSALMPEPHRSRHDEYLANYLRTGIARVVGGTLEVEAVRRDGTVFPAEVTVTEFRLEGVRHFTGVIRDLTERRKLENQFRQAQKMEAVGQLAGGVAHDFNNLLTVINGYSDLLLGAASGGDREALGAIREAGERAAGLTSQLLAFSRRSVLEPKVLDPNAVVAETGRMLTRLIGEDVRLSTALDPRAGRVRVDPGQFGQVLMNLAVNARDAMPTGGRLTIETRAVAVDEGIARGRSDLPAGRYVLVAVSDTGSGMTDEVRARVFEPFFTTKGEGQGTGLGLATVFGIVKQSGGHVEVYSEVGVGTTFKIYLPRVDASETVATPEAVQVRGGTERVLLVEDQADVRRIALIALQTYGYAVVEAVDGPDALRAAEGQPPPDLLLTDVVMPGMSGRELAERLRARFPGLRVLFMSGYTDDAVVRHGILRDDVAFIHKPYTPFGLAQKVREVLDREPDGGS